MRNRKKLLKKPQKPLDAFSQKRGRGRPRKVRPSEIQGRAQNYRKIFGEIWGRLREPLLQATTEKEVTCVFDDPSIPYTQEFVPALNALILKVIHDPKFPKRPKPQIYFIADSLAGRCWVSARSSRDICAKERARERAKSPHRILRKEFYVECSCGYKGPAAITPAASATRK
jgi:hypothetical protein